MVIVDGFEQQVCETAGNQSEDQAAGYFFKKEQADFTGATVELAGGDTEDGDIAARVTSAAINSMMSMCMVLYSAAH